MRLGTPPGQEVGAQQCEWPRRVWTLGDAVYKTDAPDRVRIEAAKLLAGRAVGARSGLFDVPRLLELDESRGLLVMERIPDLVGIRRVGASRGEYLSLVRRAGEALAEIHNGMVVEMAASCLPAPFGPGWGNTVPLHGDYSGENVCVARDRLFIIDWQATPKVNASVTHGPAAFDVSWFLGNLFRRPAYRLLRPEAVTEAARSFLAGYRRTRALDPVELGRYLTALRCHRRRVWEADLPMMKRLLLARGYRLWQQFADSNYQQEGKQHA